MKFKILDIAFDFDLGCDVDKWDYIGTVWDAEDDDDLVEQITNEAGWCIDGISYVNITNWVRE